MKFLILILLSGHLSLLGNYPNFEPLLFHNPPILEKGNKNPDSIEKSWVSEESLDFQEDEEAEVFLTSKTTPSDSPGISREMKKMITPHLLPLDHPAKSMLDFIFAESGVTKNTKSLVNAGFSIITIQSKSSIIVARHPLVPGFVFKIYRDSHPTGRKKIPGWECLVLRCMNAKKVKKIIQKHDLQHFTVPDKWLYLLPTTSSHLRKNHQPVILLATDMEIEHHKKTKNAWKTMITHTHLDELYTILNAGYGSYCLVNNIPFT
ncbi:MAG: hypothetical protein KBC64_05525, partial [Simkaniaceae bacterium]|nr:hypothetical protein [Simkaniaceae bacterium]